MLGGGGRESPRTGGGGGVPAGRESGAALLVGRGGSETGRGACTAARGGTEGGTGTAAGATDAGLFPDAPAKFSLSLALPCSSPMGSPSSLISIARPSKIFVRE